MNDALKQLYREVILDHSRHPRNFGNSRDIHHCAQGDNPLCGDCLTVCLSIDAEGIVDNASFEGKGCAISLASASMMTELVKGLSLNKIHDLFNRFRSLLLDSEPEDTILSEDENAPENVLMALSGVRAFPMRIKCATLAWHAMLDAVDSDCQLSIERKSYQ